MATRPVFVPAPDQRGLVEARDVEFQWFSGFSVAQKQRSIASLHAAAGIEPLLEISSKSTEAIGTQLSAFHLRVACEIGDVPLECVFQAGKVFERGGPYLDLLEVSPREAKRDDRLRTSGPLVRFERDGRSFPLEPKTLFYDWLYLSAVGRSSSLLGQIASYVGFTDIEFNPKKSINCQAASAARCVALIRTGRLDRALADPDSFATEVWGGAGPAQQELF